MSIVPRDGSNSSHEFWDLNGLAMSMWDPFADFPFPPSISALGFGSSMNTRVDWRETPRAHVWQVVLPRFSNEEVLLELQDERMLQVSVESGNFLTRFKIPDNANLEQLKADINHGALLVTVPKFPQQPPTTNVRLIPIDATD
ncbi:17.5 kDa class I heat shock protein [Cajanus cajan]|uniref:17.5 kDa class I heat shock protein n=1 Tax=Cajanus cajan TaxID=3821 RepID=A0A151QYZ8_CAJCA|nr:17.5 kDa class I heat shock protein [Cajanus cajan]KYP35540.1 17.5 kDa class I heat shock protein [Cajanus cajan]